MLTPVLLILLVGFASASPQATKYAESILKDALPIELDKASLIPFASLPDFKTRFQGKDSNDLTVYATANHQKGQLFGLGDAKVLPECKGTKFSFGHGEIICKISFDFLNTAYQVDIEYGDTRTQAYVTAEVSKTVIEVRFLSEPGSSYAELKNLGFKTIGTAEPKFSGLTESLKDKQKILEDSYRAHVSTEVYAAILRQYRDALAAAAGKIKMPL